MTYKEDPRAIRTQEMLKEALLTLLQEGHSLHQISIQKLTQRANLNRTTFYLHYQNINELKEHLTNDIFQVLTDKIENLTSTFDRNRQQHLLQLLDYLLEQRNHILALVQFEQIEKHLLLLMKDLIVVRRSNSKSIGRKVVVDPDVKTASIVGIIMWWLKDGLHLDSTYIAEQINLMYRS
ncbi:transcriptional regulator, TetR family [Psychrobacillus psychrotolerans]|uniref:Transcriptional regulator, TetR family n=1 Tax=Psychrobacillus psychrotolerans TaxID=126156 RepID=A0A1I5V2W0_9BACI|nr:TetR/AcrR family transcriptional regulator [Psychrobacillus psychrotolerans]SFQ01810.1 transcriptional regulator, TetR family [Psychrobacillus psychrotolerans]